MYLFKPNKWLLIGAYASVFLIPALAQKTIAVVYDDSGSMANRVIAGEPQRWMLANYAVQNMIGLLDKEDEIAVFAMSNYVSPQLIDGRSSEKLQGHIESVRAKLRAESKETPYAAVESAMKWLRKRAGYDRDLWLLVLSDGEFAEENLLVDPRIEARFREMIIEFLGKTQATPLFLLIDHSKETKMTNLWEEASQGSVIEVSSDQLVDTIRGVALKTAGRSELRLRGGSSISQKFDILLNIPLKKLTVLQQARGGQMAGLTEIGLKGAGSLQRSLQVKTRQPGSSSRTSSHISHYHPPAGMSIIAPGKLSLIFSKPIDSGTVLLLPEVALELKTSITVNGQKWAHSPTLEICKKDLLELTAWLVEPGSDQSFVWREKQMPRAQVRIAGRDFTLHPVDPSSVNPKAEFRLQIHASEVEAGLLENAGKSVVNFITMSAEFKGYFDFESNKTLLQLKPCPEYGIAPAKPWTADLDNLATGETLFEPTLDGEPIPFDEFKHWKVAVKPKGSVELVHEVTPAGWVIKPDYRFCRCFTSTGDIKVIFEVLEPAHLISPLVRPLNINRVSWWEKCLSTILFLLALILALIWLHGIFVKNRFAKGSEIRYKRNPKVKRYITSSLQNTWFKRWLIPYTPERKYVEGVLWEAGPRGKVFVIRNSIGSRDQVQVFVNDLEVPDNRPRFFMVNNQIMEVQRGKRVEQYHYSNIN